MCAEWSLKPAYANVQSTQSRRMKILCILGYPEYAQRRIWSDCANVQADLNIR